jgi:bifunctional enzyme CysN/CysC
MTAAVPSERVTGIGGATGVTVWITGLPAAGKSTLAAAVERRLAAAGVAAYHLDGDRLRTGLNADLGYDRASRRENVRRMAEVARLFAHAGTVAIAALISPYESDRVAARVVHEDDGLPFLEIYLDASLEVCEGRDPKGLYAKARSGRLAEFTGVDDPYEPPTSPDLVVDAAVPVDEATSSVVELVLRALGPRG